MGEKSMPRELIRELRQLRDGGYIRGFVASGNRCTVILKDGVISTGEEEIRQLVARIKLWTLLNEDDRAPIAGRAVAMPTDVIGA